MPQKRNPDAAELVRAKTGRIIGALVGLLTVMKGLPLTYSKDMQEDKEAVFDAAETLDLALAAMTGMVRDMQPNVSAMERAAGAGFSTATDLADWLVRELDLPFREAHHVTGAPSPGPNAEAGARRAAAGRDAGGRAAHHRRRLRGARRRSDFGRRAGRATAAPRRRRSARGPELSGWKRGGLPGCDPPAQRSRGGSDLARALRILARRRCGLSVAEAGCWTRPQPPARRRGGARRD